VQRVLALLGAVALILGAIGIRQLIAGDGDGSDNGDGGGDGGDTAVVACVSELEAACEAMAAAEDGVEVVVEDAGETRDKLVAGDSGYDGWLTFAPWPEVVGFDRPEDALGAATAPIASTELVLAAPTSTQQPCSGTDATWRCLGDTAAKVGLPPPTTGLGLLLLGNAATGYFGRSDIATNDFTPEFEEWLSRITANNRSDDPLADLLRAYPPTRIYDAVGTGRAQYDDTVPGSRAEDALPFVAPDPLATATVVVVPVNGGDVAGVATSDALVDALVESGWSEGGPDDTGLPNPGVMYDLSTR
jgi:hypothetical protein